MRKTICNFYDEFPGGWWLPIKDGLSICKKNCMVKDPVKFIYSIRFEPSGKCISFHRRRVIAWSIKNSSAFSLNRHTPINLTVLLRCLQGRRSTANTSISAIDELGPACRWWSPEMPPSSRPASSSAYIPFLPSSSILCWQCWRKIASAAHRGVLFPPIGFAVVWVRILHWDDCADAHSVVGPHRQDFWDVHSGVLVHRLRCRERRPHGQYGTMDRKKDNERPSTTAGVPRPGYTTCRVPHAALTSSIGCSPWGTSTQISSHWTSSSSCTAQSLHHAAQTRTSLALRRPDYPYE